MDESYKKPEDVTLTAMERYYNRPNFGSAANLSEETMSELIQIIATYLNDYNSAEATYASFTPIKRFLKRHDVIEKSESYSCKNLEYNEIFNPLVKIMIATLANPINFDETVRMRRCIGAFLYNKGIFSIVDDETKENLSKIIKIGLEENTDINNITTFIQFYTDETNDMSILDKFEWNLLLKRYYERSDVYWPAPILKYLSCNFPSDDFLNAVLHYVSYTPLTTPMLNTSVTILINLLSAENAKNIFNGYLNDTKQEKENFLVNWSEVSENKECPYMGQICRMCLELIEMPIEDENYDSLPISNVLVYIDRYSNESVKFVEEDGYTFKFAANICTIISSEEDKAEISRKLFDFIMRFAPLVSSLCREYLLESLCILFPIVLPDLISVEDFENVLDFVNESIDMMMHTKQFALICSNIAAVHQNLTNKGKTDYLDKLNDSVLIQTMMEIATDNDNEDIETENEEIKKFAEIFNDDEDD